MTFGGSGLDRAAGERGNPELIGEPGARVILFWRGKPLVSGDALVRLPAGHIVLTGANPERILLGRDETGPIFATELGAWQPDDPDTAMLNSFLDTSLQQHPDLPEGEVFTELRGIMTRLSARDAELAATAKAVMGWHRSHRFCAACGAESRIAMAGWQRDCAACGTHHFPRTDPVVIMLITHGNSVLVGRSPGWPEGMFSLLAGFVEPGEPIEAAVRREVFEEAGVRVGAVRYLSSQPWPFPASLMFGCAGEALDTALAVDKAELEDARWVTREEMAEVFAGRHPDIKPSRKGAIARFLLENWLADRLD